MKSIVQAIRSAINLLYITDLHGLIFEFCFHNKSSIDLIFNENKNGKLNPNPKRLTIIRYSEFIKRFEKLLQEVEVPIKYNPEYEKGFDYEDLPF